MRVGIYNRYLATLGGGEKLSLSIAEHLAQKHSVTVISHTDISRPLIARRFNLDLSQIEFLSVPEHPARDMTPLTIEYDLFINVTDMFYFTSLASASVNLVYFPAAILPPWCHSFRWQAKMAARSVFGLPAFVEGLRGVEIGRSSLTWLLESPATLRIPTNQNGCSVEFLLSSEMPSPCPVALSVDGAVIQTRQLDDQKDTLFQLSIPDSVQNCCELRICLPRQGAKMCLSRLRIDHARHGIYRLVIERWFPEVAKRLYFDLPKSWILDCINTYDAVWAISEYTRQWIDAYWGCDSDVLYSPIATQDFRADFKKGKILSVGRFFAGRHNKKHVEMIQAFKMMVDSGLTGWQLHLAGGSTVGDSHREYLDHLQCLAEGYPIVIHVDTPFEKLAELYAESAIYWHATGLGEDDLEPEKFEHFGITTIEAMASGCVPVVIDKGGQPEIVEHGVNGFLWRSVDELQSLTMQLIHDCACRERMSAAARQHSKRFDKAHFQARLDALLEKLGPGLAAS